MVDFNLNDGPATINNDAQILIQQIDILFGTRPGDLIGEPDYGTDYERFLYDLKLDSETLADQMRADLYKLDLMGFESDVQVYLLQGTERDIALINVDLYRYDTKYSKSYKIT